MMSGQQTVVDENTGEALTPAEYVSELRALERTLQRLDAAIAEFKADLGGAKKDREKLTARMRAIIRERRLHSGPRRKRTTKEK